MSEIFDYYKKNSIGSCKIMHFFAKIANVRSFLYKEQLYSLIKYTVMLTKFKKHRTYNILCFQMHFLLQLQLQVTNLCK